MIKINVWLKDQQRLIERPACQFEIEGLNIWKLAKAIEEVADAIRESKGEAR